MWWEAEAQIHPFAGGWPVVIGRFAEKATFFPLNCLGTLTENQLPLNAWIYFWTHCQVWQIRPS